MVRCTFAVLAILSPIQISNILAYKEARQMITVAAILDLDQFSSLDAA